MDLINNLRTGIVKDGCEFFESPCYEIKHVRCDEGRPTSTEGGTGDLW